VRETLSRFARVTGEHGRVGSLAEDFDRAGIVKLCAVFDEDAGEQMRQVVWRELSARHGIERDVRSTWHRHPPTGLKSTKKSRVFGAIAGATLRAALDELFGPGRWQSPKDYGQVLVTMPTATEWRVPNRLWHSDFLPTEVQQPLAAVKLWALFGDVSPGGGGTPQLAGSHRLFDRYLASTAERDYKRAKFGFLSSHPWLFGLTHDDGDPGRNRKFMTEPTTIDGVEVQVLECTGKTGDVYITHPWVFHTIAPNASDRPRFMRSLAIRRQQTIGAASDRAHTIHRP
jgi:hypothetical protein